MSDEATPSVLAPDQVEPSSAPLVKSFEVIRPHLLTEFVDRMNRRAKKLGLPPLTIEIGKPELRKQTMHRAHVFEGVITHDSGPGHSYSVEVFPVKLSVQPVKLPGPWEFAARIDHEEAGNIIAAVPGVELPTHFRTADCACEHCKTKRNRSQTYVVRNVKEDRHVQVGTDCIRDFLGHESPEIIAQQLAFIANLTTLISDMEASDREYGEGGGSGTGKYLDLRGTVEMVCAVSRKHGYVSGAKEHEAMQTGDHNVVSTRRRVSAILNDRKGEFTGKYPVTDEEVALAGKVIAWAREELGVQPKLNDYQSNLVTVTGTDSFNEKHLGIVASAPSAYAREMDIRYEREHKAKTSHHVGVVGERADFDLTLRKAIPLDGDFGLSTICVFEDATGNTVKWKASGEAPCEQGERILLKGTIKSHDNYKGVPQTVLTRCKRITALKVLPTVVPPPGPVVAASEPAPSMGSVLAAPLIEEISPEVKTGAVAAPAV